MVFKYLFEAHYDSTYSSPAKNHCDTTAELLSELTATCERTKKFVIESKTTPKKIQKKKKDKKSDKVNGKDGFEHNDEDPVSNYKKARQVKEDPFRQVNSSGGKPGDLTDCMTPEFIKMLI